MPTTSSSSENGGHAFALPTLRLLPICELHVFLRAVHHPGNAELVDAHAKTVGEESCAERHPHCAAFGQCVESALGVGGIERIALPNVDAGLLQVRSKAFDATLLIVTAAAVIALAIVAPEGR